LRGGEYAHLLAVLLVLYAKDVVTLLDQLADLGLLEDLDAVRLVLGEVFELGHQLMPGR
jgi:hypothetical protein